MCKTGWHMDCLLSPLTTIPVGIWKCFSCSPPPSSSQLPCDTSASPPPSSTLTLTRIQRCLPPKNRRKNKTYHLLSFSFSMTTLLPPQTLLSTKKRNRYPLSVFNVNKSSTLNNAPGPLDQVRVNILARIRNQEASSLVHGSLWRDLGS